MTKRKPRKEIVYKSGIIELENLPFPYVLYPGHYGAFFGFQETFGKEIVFCSCFKKSIQNYIKFRLSDPSAGYQSIDQKRYLISSSDFPLKFVETLMDANVRQNESIINHFIFKDNVCHECNKSTPNFRYCHEMYGGSFKQNFGWYIKKEAYELGIDICIFPPLLRINTITCPDEFFDIIDENAFEKCKMYPEILHFKLEDIINSKLKRKALKFAENNVRIKFGFKKVGQSWVNETLLFNTLKSMFPDYKIIYHYRPDFLKGLEIDVFIDELKIGFEYQGIQHFKPIKHFGGEKSYNDLRSRDKLKRKICEDTGLKLVYITYKEDISESLIKLKIHEINSI